MIYFFLLQMMILQNFERFFFSFFVALFIFWTPTNACWSHYKYISRNGDTCISIEEGKQNNIQYIQFHTFFFTGGYNFLFLPEKKIVKYDKKKYAYYFSSGKLIMTWAFIFFFF